MQTQMLLAVAVLSGWMGQDDDPMPTRADFIREVLDAQPTPLTHRFHDAPKGYHVVKDDLLKGLIEEAERRKMDLQGVVLGGPMGPLWTYTVVAFIREGDKMRVNVVVFPHARLTYKSTAFISLEGYEKWVAEMQGTGALESKPPVAARDEKDEGKRDRMSTLLFAISGPGGKDRRTYYSTPEELGEEKQEQFLGVLNGILKDQKTTYSVYGDDDEKQEGDEDKD